MIITKMEPSNPYLIQTNLKKGQNKGQLEAMWLYRIGSKKS